MTQTVIRPNQNRPAYATFTRPAPKLPWVLVGVFAFIAIATLVAQPVPVQAPLVVERKLDRSQYAQTVRDRIGARLRVRMRGDGDGGHDVDQRCEAECAKKHWGDSV